MAETRLSTDPADSRFAAAILYHPDERQAYPQNLWISLWIIMRKTRPVGRLHVPLLFRSTSETEYFGD
jgi:hypothetical protein